MDTLIFAGYEFLSAFVPFLIVLIINGFWRKKRHISFGFAHYIGLLLFSIYIIGVYHFTGVGTLYDGLHYQLEMNTNQLNLIPFSNEIDSIAYLLNVVLFVPLGILLPIPCEKMDTFWHIFSVGFCFSFFIEVSQLLNNRCTDIDDLFLNTIGALLGFLLFKIWKKGTKSEYCFKYISRMELVIYIIVLFFGRFLFFNEMGLASLLYKF